MKKMEYQVGSSLGNNLQGIPESVSAIFKLDLQEAAISFLSAGSHWFFSPHGGFAASMKNRYPNSDGSPAPY